MISNEAKVDIEKYPLTHRFFKKLSKFTDGLSKHSTIAFMYKKFFLLSEIDNLEISLEYMSKEYDEHKENGWWFTSFHKSLRQSDFFDGYYKKEALLLLTKEQEMKRKEFRSMFLNKKEDGLTKD